MKNVLFFVIVLYLSSLTLCAQPDPFDTIMGASPNAQQTETNESPMSDNNEANDDLDYLDTDNNKESFYTDTKKGFWHWHWNWEFIAGAIGFGLFLGTILCVICVYKYDHYNQQTYGFHPIDINSLEQNKDGELDSLKKNKDKDNMLNEEDSDTDVSIEQEI